jgi:cytochrome P450
MRFGRTNFTRQIDTLRDEVAALVAERYRSGEPAADLLDYLIHAPDHVSGNPMPPGQVLDELITLIFAGSETTEKALAWIFYLLASHPDIEAGLYETIRRIPGRIAFEHLPLLEPLRPVIEETLRLYPPAWILGRRARQDDPFMGYLIPAGERAVINVYAIHHNPRLWRDPETFDPARFADPLLEARNNGNYLAFGLGPRFCLGSHLSMVEIQLTVASILQRYKLRPARARRVDAAPQISLAPRNGIWMTLEKR